MVGLGQSFHDEGLVDVRDDTTAGDSGFNKRVELFVTADGQLQVAWGDALDLEVFAGVTCQFENLSREVFENSSGVDCCSGADAGACVNTQLEDSVNSAHGELTTQISKY